MNGKHRYPRPISFAGAALCGALAAHAGSTQAGELSLSRTPLFLGGVEPNVFFMLDDSGSMDWEVLTRPYHWFGLYYNSTAPAFGGLRGDGLWLGYARSGECAADDSVRNITYIFGNTDNVYGPCGSPNVVNTSQYYEFDWRGLSPSFNLLYYNPSTDYEPWPGLPDASFTAARSDPEPAAAGYDVTTNLGTEDLALYSAGGFVYELTVDDRGFDELEEARVDGEFVPSGPASANDRPNGLVDAWDSHVRFRVDEGAVTVQGYTYDPRGAGRDCGFGEAESTLFGGLPLEPCYGTALAFEATLSGSACYDVLGESAQALVPGLLAGTVSPGATGGAGGRGCRTVAEAQQNIANWYQYARRRSFVTKGSVGELLEAIPDYRYGLSLINRDEDLFVEMPTYGSDYSSHNDDLLDRLYSFDWPLAGTPLRAGLRRAGDYYKGDLARSSPIVESCQKNFTLLFTDGYYNARVEPDDDMGDLDGDGVIVDDPEEWFEDDLTSVSTVADIAHYFYHTDLSDLTDDVPPDAIDPATHQHMVTMTVAFGVTGNLEDNYVNNGSLAVVGGEVTAGDPGSDGIPDMQQDGSPWTGDDNKPIFGDGQEDLGWTDEVIDRTGAERIDDLWHAAHNSKGVYINAQTPAELVAAMRRALAAIEERVSSASSVALNSGSLNENTRTYQARFDSRDWSGQLLSIPISDGSGNATCTTEQPGALCDQEWDGGAELADQHWSTERTIFTWFPGDGTTAPGGAAFRWGSLSAAQQEALRTNPDTGALEDEDMGRLRLEFLRGDDSEEGGTGFRDRAGAKLGDIVHSSPIFVGGASFLWPDNLKTGTIASPGGTYSETYSAFRARVADRTPLIYVGANDGMLHAFNAYFNAAGDATSDSGREVMAYVPNVLFEHLPELTSPEYEHRYYVNGDITRGDVYFPSDSEWHTVLVGTLRGGGQGVYALDVTSPGTGTSPAGFSESEPGPVVLWEFTDTDNPHTVDGEDPLVDGDPDLGYTFSQPAIARMANGRWAAVFGNGYNNTEADGSASSSGNAVLFVVDVETGELLAKLDTGAGTADDPDGAGRPNALASPTPIDRDRDHFAEAVYAGDLFGNVWKFDVSNPDPAAWSVGNGGDPLFVATDGDVTSDDTGYTAQPITTRIVTGPHPTDPGGVMLYFGTGKYVEVTDNSSSGEQTQTFYGIWDDGTTGTVARSDLLVQKIIDESLVTLPDASPDAEEGATVEETVRVTTDESDPVPAGETGSPYAIDWSSHKGWLMDLVNYGAESLDNRGERVDADPLLRNQRIIFITTLPNESPCAFGGNSFLMELDANDGSRLSFSPFDLNNDRDFTESDYVTVTINDVDVQVPVSGRRSKEGIIQRPGVLVSRGAEYKYGAGSAGGVDVTVENPGPLTLGRQSWRQLR